VGSSLGLVVIDLLVTKVIIPFSNYISQLIDLLLHKKQL